MRIKKLILKNFAAIANAMDTETLTIDFSNSVNKICLIIGPNGSGKTSILSMLHPFAEVGTLDNRNNLFTICEEKDGYKEITIERGDDEYVIKHYYTHHSNKNHTIKSYIEKNGVELNENGNVSSFKEYVKEELQIEPDYLRLIRIGSNVSSLISLSSTERKTFMSKLMDDIGIFLTYYKSVNTKLKQLDDLISHDIDKEKKLGIIDKDDYQDKITELSNDIAKEQDTYMKLNGNKTLLLATFDAIEDKENLYQKMNETVKKYNKMTRVLENKKNFESLDPGFYREKLDSLNSKKEKNKIESDNLLLLVQNTLNHTNTLYEQVNTYEVELNKELEIDKEIQRLDKELTTKRKRLREYEDNIGDFKSTISRKDLEDFIQFLNSISDIVNLTYEFGKKPISKVLDLISKKKNVNHYIDSHLIEIDDNTSNKTAVFMATISKTIKSSKGIPEDCNNELCPARKMYKQIETLLKNSEVEDKVEDSQFYISMRSVYNNIQMVIDKISYKADIIKNLPDDLKKEFEVDVMFEKLKKLQVLFTFEKYNDILSLTSEVEAYEKELSEYTKIEDTLGLISSKSNSGTIKKMLNTIKDDIKESEDNIVNWKKRINVLDEEIDDATKTIEVYTEILETLEKYDEIKELQEKYTKDFEAYKATKDELEYIEINLAKSKSNIDRMTSEMQEMNINLAQHEELQKEISKMSKVYDEMRLVKDALSSRQGIPLYFISNYLMNTEQITNELLDIAYDGKIYIDAFEITPTEFSIPFFNKGIRLSDVKYASQGELSFLSVALSFALSSQALSKYNIMLLDEIDGPLDSSNREKFIKILENQIDRINADQSFLITHNAMFSSYPVDIIDLSFSNEKNDYRLANYIDVIKS